VPVAAVREVIPCPPLTPVPGTPDWLPGVANVRGDIVTVLDPAVVLGQPTATTGRRHLIVVRQEDDAVVGLTVGEVIGLRRLTVDDDRPADAGAFVAGVTTFQGRLVQRLDLPAVLAATAAEPV
jgi:chemotaxis signal transduction protein